MKLLILGGTKFVGRHLTAAALAGGHRVTLFHRGRTNPDVFPEVERVLGDRDGGLDALAGRTWDAVVDTCGYVPRLVGASAERLVDAVDRYVFVSSISVYRDFLPGGFDESSPVGTIDDPDVEEIDARTYGPLKALCESAVDERFPGRAIHVRAGLIVGPHDPTDRFTYWPRRWARGGAYAAPGEPGRPVQFVDVRDLAAWIVRMAEGGTAGVYNATGPAAPLTMGGFLASGAAAVRSTVAAPASGAAPAEPAVPVWIPDGFLAARDVPVWTGLPFWIPDDHAGGNFLRADGAKAIAAGLTFRPLAETVRDTLAWDRGRPGFRADGSGLAAGLAPEAEAELLAAWAEARPARPAGADAPGADAPGAPEAASP